MKRMKGLFTMVWSWIRGPKGLECRHPELSTMAGEAVSIPRLEGIVQREEIVLLELSESKLSRWGCLPEKEGDCVQSTCPSLSALISKPTGRHAELRRAQELASRVTAECSADQIGWGGELGGEGCGGSRGGT